MDYQIFIQGKNSKITEKNPIKLKKALLQVDPTLEMQQIKHIPDTIKITTKSVEQKMKFLKLDKLLGEDITVTEHRNKAKLFFSQTVKNKVIIFGVNLDISEEEIIESTGANAATRLQKKSLEATAYNRYPTTTVILSFDNNPPQHVEIGWLSFQTKPYIPPPVRCFKCQLYGHVSASCRGRTTCPRCAQNHDFANCPLKYIHTSSDGQNNGIKCPNCGLDHPAGYKGCSAFQRAKEITKFKTLNNMTYSEALKKINQANTQPKISTHLQNEEYNSNNLRMQINKKNRSKYSQHDY